MVEKENNYLLRDQMSYNTKQACQIMGINRNLLDNYRRCGLIKAIKTGKIFIYPKTEIQRFLDDNLDKTITKEGVIIKG